MKIVKNILFLKSEECEDFLLNLRWPFIFIIVVLFSFYLKLTDPPAFSIFALADLEIKSVFTFNFSFISPVPRTFNFSYFFLIIFLSIKYFIVISS